MNNTILEIFNSSFDATLDTIKYLEPINNIKNIDKVQLKNNIDSLNTCFIFIKNNYIYEEHKNYKQIKELYKKYEVIIKHLYGAIDGFPDHYFYFIDNLIYLLETFNSIRHYYLYTAWLLMLVVIRC